MLDASYPIALSPPVDLPVNPPLYSIRTRQEIQFLQLLTILQLNQRVKHRTYHKRAGLPCSKNSDWTVLYAAKDDDQFIHMMGIDVASFEHLVKAIDQYLAAVQNNNNYNNRNRNNRINSNNNNDSEEFMESKYQDYNNEADPQVVGQTKGNESEAKEAGGVIRRKKNQSHHNQARVIHRRKKNKGGRPSGLDSKGKLALLLYYLHQPVQQKALAVTFGILESTCSITLSQMLPLFEQVLMREADASIRWPTRSEMKEFAEQIAYVHPNLPDPVWGFLDGVFFPNDSHPDEVIQNSYYNGHKKTTSVTNVIVFTPDGCMCWAAINRPGSWHDARVVLPLYDYLKQYTLPGYKLIADTAFEAQPAHILTPFKKGQFSRITTEALAQLHEHYRIVSARQTVEWGMRTVQAVFPRLKVPLTASNFEYNGLLISVCFRMYNFRTRRLHDLNQIKTVYSRDYLRPLF